MSLQKDYVYDLYGGGFAIIVCDVHQIAKCDLYLILADGSLAQKPECVVWYEHNGLHISGGSHLPASHAFSNLTSLQQTADLTTGRVAIPQATQAYLAGQPTIGHSKFDEITELEVHRRMYGIWTDPKCTCGADKVREDNPGALIKHFAWCDKTD